MEVVIKGDPKEIAVLVLELQKYKPNDLFVENRSDENSPYPEARPV